MKDTEIIGLGALNIDQIYGVPQILTEGEVAIDSFLSALGGSAANTIYGLAQLGVTAGFVGAVGDDEAGHWMIQDFQKVGVDTTHIKVKGEAQTGSVMCLSDRRGGRALYVSPGANNVLEMEDIDLAYLNRARVLHLSSFANEKQLNLQLKLVSELNPSVKLSFAPGTLYSALGLRDLAPLLRRTWILFVNQLELEQLTGEGPPEGGRLCLEQGCRMVAATMGKGEVLEGGRLAASYIFTGEQEYLIEGQQPGEVKDTTGAGDAFAAGFLYGWLRGKGPQQCGYLGDLMASFCIARIGARAGLPKLAELASKYERLYGQG